jgi:diguanylate cyclase (GGDEF)-like protein
MKLRTKFLLLLTTLIVGPLLVVGTLGYAQLRSTSEEKTFDQMRNVVDRLADEVNGLARTASANIDLFSRHLIVQRYVLAKDANERYALLQRPLLQVFRSFQEAYPEYYELRILMPDGFEDARWSREGVRAVPADAGGDSFFRLLDSTGALTVSVLPGDGTTVMQVGNPLVLSEPRTVPPEPPVLRGYLAVTVDLDQLRSSFESSRTMHEERSFATDAEGTVLLDTVHDDVGARLPDEVFRALRGGLDGGTVVRVDRDGVPVYVTGARTDTNLYVFTAIPVSALLAASHHLRSAVTPIIVAAILLTLILLYFGLDRMVIAPIRALGRAAGQIGRGELDVQIASSSGDEIGELATAFGEMSHNLGESNEQIRMLAYHDALTGLPNRRLFHELLDKALARAQREHEGLAILFVDFDNFKRINDSVGHAAADGVLRELGETLSSIIRTDDVLFLHTHGETETVVSRLGGDEFVILLPHTRDRFSPGVVARRILHQLARPIRAGEQEVIVSASIGVATFPEDGATADMLIRNADSAMYHAKQQGKAGYLYYSEAMNVASVERLTLESGLRRALEQDRLELHYQPQIDLVSGRVIGAEALLRWKDPERGYISPATFIPLAEETGLILTIGEWVINRACQQAMEWQRAGLVGIPISVNVSGAQFSRQNLSNLVARALDSSGLQPALLCIEITETAMMAVPDRAVELLLQLRTLGVRLSLDDFGTGYSSLSYLRRFPISTLKIDRSFVCEVLTDDHTASITEAIIGMAHVLGLRVVAEGVEQQEQISLLRRWRCDAVQGYYYSPALPAPRFAEFLASGSVRVDDRAVEPLRIQSA